MRQRPLDIRDAVRQGLIPVMTDALRSEDADVREAALALLALLMQHPAIVQLAQKVRHTLQLLSLSRRCAT